MCSGNSSGRTDFYPRPPRGGRPTSFPLSFFRTAISIHALREEGDKSIKATQKRIDEFLSTPSARRATAPFPRPLYRQRISIHALREEGDQATANITAPPFTNFYPRPPRGGRQKQDDEILKLRKISIHALREEGDWAWWVLPPLPFHFYPRPPRGGRLSTSPMVLRP